MLLKVDLNINDYADGLFKAFLNQDMKVSVDCGEILCYGTIDQLYNEFFLRHKRTLVCILTNVCVW